MGTHFHVTYIRTLCDMFNCERDVDKWSVVCFVGWLVGWLVGCLPGNNVLKTGTIFRFIWNGAR